MNKAGLEPVWVQGRRYTDERTLAIVEHTLVNKVNQPICGILNDMGIKAMGLHSLSSCAVFAEPLRLEGQDGRKLDLGLVGKTTEINADLLTTLCTNGVIPVIAPVARSKTGGKLNINADSVAGHVAAAVKAEKLVVLSDTHGIRMDMDDPDSWISSVSEAEIEEMIKNGIISSGMMPKVEACITALNGGTGKAHIIDGRIPHSLLLEIYTDKGIGTQIINR
jgi:acetylglutamate kinase